MPTVFETNPLLGKTVDGFRMFSYFGVASNHQLELVFGAITRCAGHVLCLISGDVLL